MYYAKSVKAKQSLKSHKTVLVCSVMETHWINVWQISQSLNYYKVKSRMIVQYAPKRRKLIHL
jgi:hypothetical protein